MSKNKVKENSHIFKCPKCGSRMNVYNLKSLICLNNYCFDISKNGYINFLLNLNKSDYDKSIFKSRNMIFKSGFFEPMIDVVDNILSPSNYSEFKRLMSDEGILIKVIPGSNYLKELREVFYDEREKQSYSNKKVIAHFKNNFRLIDKKEVMYTVDLNEGGLKYLMEMTPLSWNIPKERIEKVLKIGLNKITADFAIIYGKNKFMEVLNFNKHFFFW